MLILTACTGSRDERAGEPAVPSAASAASTTPAAIDLAVEEVARGLQEPVYLAAPTGDPRLFIVERAGRIRIFENGKLTAKPFLDITAKVRNGGEQGFLSFAFHPHYSTNGFLFAHYTDRKGDTRIERYAVSSDSSLADPASAKLILSIDQRYSNHQGGLNLFGPDGHLFIGMGDGGAQGDPHGNGQNRNALLGKLLRLNVDRGDPYTVPASNPYARNGQGRGEIWATGLRNPWRFAFDHRDGMLYIADVGQGSSEEINVAPHTTAGLNGWNVMEGSECYRLPLCHQSGKQTPALTYSHSDGSCSVIGGFVYRGRKLPAIQGHYFYSDYCSGWLRSFRFAGGTVRDRREWPVGDLGTVVSFGEDGAGELYLVSQNGRVYRLVAAKAPA
ncbi:MAG TPA: PQQ-dependent sugar dehydrogenase [Gemmatimonadaceae bacterium]|nr:PQQ-dependent sugar dehydrogenase [Gemmatimonadaceae bacterium]